MQQVIALPVGRSVHATFSKPVRIDDADFLGSNGSIRIVAATGVLVGLTDEWLVLRTGVVFPHADDYDLDDPEVDGLVPCVHAADLYVRAADVTSIAAHSTAGAR